MVNLLAFDFGASGGRAVLGQYDGARLSISTAHQFANEPVRMNATLYWDFPRLFHEMKQGILRSRKLCGGEIASLGTDTWGVDFGLLDRTGQLAGNPVHYRDARTCGMPDFACRTLSARDLYRRTGTQIMQINTLFQLLAMRQEQSPLLEITDTLLMMPDLFNYFLTGERAGEFSIATTTQMFDWAKGNWATDLLQKFGFDGAWLPPLIRPGTVLGKMTPKVAGELSMDAIPVVAVAGHDTECAMAAVPAREPQFAYLSCGTWSLLGTELAEPMLGEAAYASNFTNEGGYGGAVSFHKNIMGLWLYQECIRDWTLEGATCEYGALEKEAAGAPAFAAFLDPDDESFMTPGGMPKKIRAYCVKTGQTPPETRGAIVRCLMESLAMKYRLVLDELEALVGHSFPALYLVGGGSRNRMLCQFTANATRRPVRAGPAEATAIGNLLCQLLAAGCLKSLSEARQVVRDSFSVDEYLPENAGDWSEAYEKYKAACVKTVLQK